MTTTIRSIDQAIAEDKLILLADPRITAIPIYENNEPMIELKNQTEIAYGPSPEIENNTCYTKIRKTVYEKLIEAQKLLPQDMKFCLYEGWRSFELQKELYEHRYALIAKEHPHWSHEEIFKENTKMVSPVILLNGEKNIPPHATGAAVDIYLTDNHGNILDMGILAKDWMQDVDGLLSYTHSDQISATAQKNREIMSNVLSAVGFVNYPTEYWHWSYGDRYWAYHTKHSHAFYGPITQNPEIITYEEFEKVEIRSGTIIKAEPFERARKPAYKVWVDFGPIYGIKQTSAQVTKHYSPESLIGKQIAGCINLGKKNIAGFQSEFLLLGFSDDNGNICLITPDPKVSNGQKLH